MRRMEPLVKEEMPQVLIEEPEFEVKRWMVVALLVQLGLIDLALLAGGVYYVLEFVLWQ